MRMLLRGGMLLLTPSPRVPFGGIRNRWWCCKHLNIPSNKMADAYDVDDTGGWDATHEAAAAAAAAHAAGECFHVLVIFLDTCVPAPQGIMCRYDIRI